VTGPHAGGLANEPSWLPGVGPAVGPVGLPPRPPSVEPWVGLERVLAVRLDAAGDVVMTTPALRALRRAGVHHLALLTSASGAAAAQLLPEVDEIIVHEASWMKPAEKKLQAGSAPDESAAEFLALVDRLRDGHFDGAVVFTVNSQSALPAAVLCLLAGIERRLAHCRENPYALLTDWVPDPEVVAPIRHEVRRQLDLLAAVGIVPADEHLSIHVPDTASRSVRARLDELGISASPVWVAVHPGATAASRRYPPERLGVALAELHGRTGWPVVYTGDGGERDLVEAVRDSAGGVGESLAGELPFAELAALIAVAPLLITNNTGPAHLAAAVATPVVDLYALTNLQHTPWAVPSRILSVDVPCRGCLRSICPLGHNRCLRAVEPAEIVAATLDLAREVGLVVPEPLEIAR
jgi:ADP-heptose:LPS heptosyltransferase